MRHFEMGLVIVTAVAALTLALFAGGCASTKSPSAVPVAPAPVAEPAVEDAAPSDCVQTCTDGRRTEAIGWDIIVAECEAQCAAEGGG